MKVLIIMLIVCASALANSEVAELLYPTFRGNNQRNSVGTGTLPVNPEVLWRYPEKRMCGKTKVGGKTVTWCGTCLLYTSPSPRDKRQSRMPSSA